MSGRLIVVEGIDGSGKSTQFAALTQRLEREGRRVRTATFPRYDQPSSALIRMYLGGAFGDEPDAVGPYPASVFYAVDRYASFVCDWRADFERGTDMLCDRYTTSNAVHQAAKLEPCARGAFLDWLFDFEYRILGLPKPDGVLYLDMPTELAIDLIGKRGGADIHELDHEYLARCRQAALGICQAYGWQVIECARGGRVRDSAEIAEEVYARAQAWLMRDE